MINRRIETVCTALFTIILILLNSSLLASTEKERISVESLGKIVVLEEGRKKPLDTYARNKLIQFSGKQKVSGLSALQWISQVIFNPDKADRDLIFLIDNPEVADAMGISPRAKRRYSFFELYSASDKLSELSNEVMKKDASELNAFDRVVINIDRNLQEYFLIRSTFSFLEPLPYLAVSDSTLSQKLGVSADQPLSYFNLMSRAEVITEGMKKIQQTGIDSLNPEYIALLDLTRRMYDLEKSLENPHPHLIPGKEANDGQWLGLWGLVNQYKSAVYDQKSLMYMVKIRDAYLNGDQQKFDESVNHFKKIARQDASAEEKLPDPSLELFYNKLNPFFYAKVLYGFAALLSLLSIALLWKKISAVSFCFVLAGVILHTTGIISRMIIMSHPQNLPQA
ncbi:MAG TPA: hypothetical protein VHP36_06895 [Chitinispirillaceae bacterium]|nr:hypothetical protein [Chitinispirillaceae bacterium]